MPFPLTAAPRIRRWTAKARMVPVLCAFLLTACAAPGMKLNSTPSSHPRAEEMGGLQVTLRPLEAQAQPPGSRPINLEVLRELLSDQPMPYLIGAQDVLLVTVWDHPEITLALGQYRTDNASGNVVDDDGQMFFPYVGRIMAKGLTIPQFRTSLTAALARVLQNPQVDVKVIAYRSQKVFVGGEVKNPAVYTVTDVPFTLAEAINRAGGFSPIADDSRITLTRGNRTWLLDFHLLMTQGNQIGRLYLKDGDALQVPTNLEAPVYMMGEVIRPGTLPLVHGNLSLAKAISDAGGLIGATADARYIYVIRAGGAPNAVDVFHLDARNPTALVMADHFPLYPRDIIYVDTGTAGRFSRIMNNILPTVNAITSATATWADVRYLRQHP